MIGVETARPSAGAADIAIDGRGHSRYLSNSAINHCGRAIRGRVAKQKSSAAEKRISRPNGERSVPPALAAERDLGGQPQGRHAGHLRAFMMRAYCPQQQQDMPS